MLKRAGCLIHNKQQIRTGERMESENYKQYVSQLLSTFNLGDIIRMTDLITNLCDLLPPNNELVEDANILINEVKDNLLRFQTANLCPKCGFLLYLSNLPQYDQTCYECEENF